MVNPILYINIFTSIVSITMGVLILTGIILPGLEMKSKYAFGGVFLAYGIYRMLNVVAKVKKDKQEKRHAMIKKAQEELIKKQK